MAFIAGSHLAGLEQKQVGARDVWNR